MKGHPAMKYYRKGFAFLPCDLRCQLMAYNTKYRDLLDTDISSNNEKRILPAPIAKLKFSTWNRTNANSNCTVINNFLATS